MVELIVRLCTAIGFLGIGFLDYAPFDVSWKAAAALTGIALFRWKLEERSLVNGGVAGFFAVAEAFTLAIFLASTGTLPQLGVLVLIPCIYAAARFSAPMISMAPLAASALVASACIFSKDGIPGPQVLMHAAGVLSVSLLLGQRRPQHRHEPTAMAASEPNPAPQIVEDGLLQLRESYRKLRDAYNDLERKSRKDKISARIAKVQLFEGGKFYTELCGALRDLTRSKELAIYTLAQLESTMVVKGFTEEFPNDMKDRSIAVDVSKANILLREQAEEALKALSAGAPVANVLLMHKGKVVGMACAIESRPTRLDEIRRTLSEAAPEVAKVIETEAERETNARRLKEVELLYEVASTCAGAATPKDLAARVARELRQILSLDGVRICEVADREERPLAMLGSKAALLDCIGFAKGVGLAGWLESGSPDVVLFDVRQDPRCDPEQSLKRRIGSFLLVPIWNGLEIAGYLSAATQALGGIDTHQIATCRLVAAELSRALERLQGSRLGGMMTPGEFSAATSGKQGSLVHLEPLRREQAVGTYGIVPFEEAVRKFAHQVRAKLPAGSCLCRRDQGDFVVFIESDEEAARNWANQIAASASLIAISTSDPTKRVPLALRAKVAKMTSQSHQLSVESAA